METTDNTNPTAAVISGVVGTSLIVVILVLVGLCIVRVWKNCKKRNNDSCVREIQMTVIGNSSNANPVTAEVICKCLTYTCRYNYLIANNYLLHMIY